MKQRHQLFFSLVLNLEFGCSFSLVLHQQGLELIDDLVLLKQIGVLHINLGCPSLVRIIQLFQKFILIPKC